MLRKIPALFLLFLLSITSLAQTDSSPATQSPAENECFAGGVMAGKCHEDFNGDGTISQDEIDWAWNCGWYLAQFNRGLIAVTSVPDWCRSLVGPVAAYGTFSFSSTLFSFRLIGNHLSQDDNHDGVYEKSWYIVSDSGPGDGGNCPSGSSFSGAEVANYASSATDFYAWLISFGFGHYDDFCSIA